MTSYRDRMATSTKDNLTTLCGEPMFPHLDPISVVVPSDLSEDVVSLVESHARSVCEDTKNAVTDAVLDAVGKVLAIHDEGWNRPTPQTRLSDLETAINKAIRNVDFDVVLRFKVTAPK